MSTVVVLKLDTGESIIVDLLAEEDGELNQQEDDEAEILVFRFPLQLSNVMNETGETIVSFAKWNPYTADIIQTVPKYHVVSVSGPQDELFEAYIEAVPNIFDFDAEEVLPEDELLKQQQIKILESLDKTKDLEQ